MIQCKAQAEDASGLWRCLVDEGHVGEHRFDAAYYRAENARLQARVEEAEDAAGMFQLQMRAAMQIKGERDRYKALAEEAEQHIDRLEATVVAAAEDLEKAEALAERRKEALGPFAKITDGLLRVWELDTMPDDYVVLGEPDPRALYCVTWGQLKIARAAIEEEEPR